ncbi:hypothetical protein RJT34_30426 [Clitoria ternatea]|uniref:Uncharacterized protein n=1 Tax=Clitoria ternatea TaxID=43366 RepID=A0AAN9EWZ3_CLITE
MTVIRGYRARVLDALLAWLVKELAGAWRERAQLGGCNSRISREAHATFVRDKVLGSVWFPVGETELGKWRNLRVDIDPSRRSI